MSRATARLRTARPKAPLRHRLWSLQHRSAPYLFLAPVLLLFTVFLLYPLVRSLVMSLHQYAGTASRYVGARNYGFMVRDEVFWGALGNTAGYAVVFLAIQIPASLGLALLLDSRRVRMRGFFRFAFFSTHLVGQVFVAVLFAVLLSPRAGLLNRAIGFVLGRPVEINWLGEPNLAMPAVILASLWLTIGFGMIYFLAALQSVDRELYDAAAVDGAGPWTRFRHVTLPGIRPVLAFLVLVGTIGAFQLFELPWVLFGGTGPGSRGMTIVMWLYINGWEMNDLGYAAAIGWALVAILLVIALAQSRALRAR